HTGQDGGNACPWKFARPPDIASRLPIPRARHAPLSIDCLNMRLGLSRQVLHAFHDLRVAKNTLRLEPMPPLRPPFVDSRVGSSEVDHTLPEFERLGEIVRTLPLCLGNRIVGDGSRCPRRLD